MTSDDKHSEWEFGGIKASELVAVLNSSDKLGQVLKGHLAVEAVLGTALSTKMALPQAFQRMRLSFARKVQLAVALGLVPGADEAAFVVLNALRNALAHDCHCNISKKDGERLIRALSKAWREAPPVVEYVERGLDDLLIIGIIVLHAIASKAVEAAIDENEGRVRLRESLDTVKARWPDLLSAPNADQS
jgi:hypothetical protein